MDKGLKETPKKISLSNINSRTSVEGIEVGGDSPLPPHTKNQHFSLMFNPNPTGESTRGSHYL